MLTFRRSFGRRVQQGRRENTLLVTVKKLFAPLIRLRVRLVLGHCRRDLRARAG
jgi:hypothetical protein